MKFTSELLARYGGPKKTIEEFGKLEPQAVELARLCDWFCREVFGKEILITSLRRPEGGHATGRMFDFDVDEHREYGGLSPDEAAILADAMNFIMIYDPSRPTFSVLVYGENDSKGAHWNHVHGQVCFHQQTRYRRTALAEWYRTKL